jgi:hypothetical protein
LILALGWLIGSPRIGVILSGALASVATAWMLRARMSWRWSLIGGAIAILLPTVYEWTQNFWGGCVAMTGGALFVGAMLRAESALLRRARVGAIRIGVLAGAGLAILANSRPFEGVLLAVIVGVLLLVRLLRKQRFTLNRLIPFVGGSAIVLAPVAIWMGYYNYRVTGDALRMPYAVHAQQYMVAPVFWWQPLQAPSTDIPHIAGFHRQFEFREYERQTTFAGFFENAWRKVRMVQWMCFWPLIYYPALIGGWFAFRRWRSARFALVVPAILFIAHISSTPWLRAHYLAPVVPLWIMFVVYAIRGIARIRFVPREITISMAEALIIGSTVFALHTNILAAIDRREVGDPRGIVLDALKKVPGRHIIFVDYAPGPQNEFEWVSNGADLVDAPVLWVHSRQTEQDMQLVEQYPDRNVWFLRIENEHFDLKSVLMRE